MSIVGESSVEHCRVEVGRVVLSIVVLGVELSRAE